jgi:hypothetical protein
MRCLKELNLNKNKSNAYFKKQFFFLLLCNGVIAQQHWDIEGRFPGR